MHQIAVYYNDTIFIYILFIFIYIQGNDDEGLEVKQQEGKENANNMK